MNCEDIAMNFLVANYTGKAPIKVSYIVTILESPPKACGKNLGGATSRPPWNFRAY
jgi:hypothetical protein